MEDWEIAAKGLAWNLAEYGINTLTDEQLVHMRAYIGREFNRRQAAEEDG